MVSLSARTAARAALLFALTTTVLSYGSSARAAPSAFVIHPYLQHLGTSEVTVRFELPHESEASIELRTSAGASTYRSTPGKFHSVTLPGLHPATTYSYVVRSGPIASEPASFTTANHDPNRPFSFVLYGDSRSGSVPHNNVVRGIEATPSDFLIGTGDVVVTGGDRDAWLEFFAIEQRLLSDRCLFSAIGNHELTWPGKSRHVWNHYFAPHRDEHGPTWFSVRWGNTRIFLLDAMEQWNGAQGEWVRTELAKADTEPGIAHRFVVMHHAPFSSGPHGPNKRFLDSGLLDVFVRHKVELVMGGHDHIYERAENKGIKYLISGGAGAPLYDYGQGAGSQSGLSAYHFVELKVDGDLVTAIARKPDRSVIEQCSFQNGSPWKCGDPPAAAASAGPVEVLASKPDVPGTRGGRCGCSIPGIPAPWGGWLAVAAPLAAALLRRRNRHS